MKNRVKVLWLILAAAGILGGAVLLGAGSLPFGVLKPLADRLSANGSLASFTEASFQKIAPGLAGAGLVLLLAGLGLVLLRRWSVGWVARFAGFAGAEWGGVGKDAAAFFKTLWAARPGLKTILAVGLLTLAAAATRWTFIGRFLSHDEAYTFEAFAVRPLFKVISDYHLPNNHVLHTLFVHFSFLLFGDAPWAVRLPAFLAGVLMVPATFLLARRLYNWNVALVSAALVAAAPVMISFSTNARGYTLLALITLLAWTLGLYLKEHRNRFGWLALGVLCALGFYTLPVFLYPYGILLAWLFISNLAGDRGAGYVGVWSMIGCLVLSGLATVGLTLALYTPIFIYSGVGSVTSNTFVEALSWSDFTQTLPLRLGDTWAAFSQDFPPLGWAFLMSGVLLSLGFHKWIARDQRFPLQLAVLAWLVPVFILQRPNPWAKVWTYLFAPLMIWGAAGLLAFFKDIYLDGNRDRRWRHSIQTLLAVGLTAVLLGWNGWYSIQNYAENIVPKEIEKTAAYLKDQLQAGDMVVVSSPNDSVFWYYARRQQIPSDYYFGSRERDYRRAVVIVNPNYEQTLASVLKDRGPLAPSCQEAQARLLKQIDNTQVYECFK